MWCVGHNSIKLARDEEVVDTKGRKVMHEDAQDLPFQQHSQNK